MTRFIPLLLLVLLAACGGGSAPEPTAPGAPRFGDSNPTDWQGRGPEEWPVHGVDASKFQNDVNWAAARASGVNFAFLKATEGGDRVDDRFAEYWAQTRRAGVLRGAYHFYYFCTTPEVQAQNFINTVPKERGSLPPVVDLEWNPFSPTCTYRPPAAEVREQVSRFIEIVARHYGQRPIIYTTPDFWERNEIARLGGETWLRAVARHPENIYPGARWTFWQYSSTGQVPGFVGNTDLNAFGGSPAAWAAWVQRRSVR
ncbi:glycoside hydrolase family 25 protein [Oceaniglobus roseus]|uniref:glycoside hydrolase family 25 protein n=1 Tax=Oceaniglobus roseus TaxID=1737570 RepID=UPI000C7F031F|nr:GH25 family lysozyme [Kandeliimicrobium roseum]